MQNVEIVVVWSS